MSFEPYQQKFYDQFWPLAQTSSQYGLSPEIVFAQAALESNWGRSAPNNNYFGIKGPGGTQTTKEFVNGQWVTIRDSFRGYSSAADSVRGYIDFIFGNKRYTEYRTAQGIDAQLGALGSSGYATDPGYIGKLKSIISDLPQSGGSNVAREPDVLKWLLTGDSRYSPFSPVVLQNNGLSTSASGGVLEDTRNAVSKTIDDIMSKLSDPLKRAGFVVVALVIIAAALFLMMGNKTIVVQPASA